MSGKAEKQSPPPDLRSLFSFLRQLLAHRNFSIFIVVGLLQVFNCHFNSNFLATLLKQFIPTVRFGLYRLRIAFYHYNTLFFCPFLTKTSPGSKASFLDVRRSFPT